MLLRLESEVALESPVWFFRLIRAQRSAHSVRAGEFGHNETTSAQIADEAPENCIGYPSHGGQDGRGRDGDVANGDVSRETHKYSLTSRYQDEAAARGFACVWS